MPPITTWEGARWYPAMTPHPSWVSSCPIHSPFSGQSPATEPEIVAWLNEVEQQNPDIVVLDYGMEPEALLEHRAAIRRLARTALVVAAAGNTGKQADLPGSR